MGEIGVFIGLSAAVFAWAWIVKRTRAKGWRGIAAHGSGALMALPIMLAVFAVISEPDLASFIIFGIVAGVLHLIVRPRAAVAVAVPPAVEQQPPPPIDDHSIDAVRRQSLAAMKRATKARELDKKARGEIDAAPLKLWSPDGAGAVCDIEFDYVDAKGKPSHRHVSVDAVDKEYLEGFCHTAMATRTFVIGRVRGKILDRDSGELTTPKKWAEQARRDPRNGTVSMGGGRSTMDYEDEDDDVEPTEVLFTGFPAARRDELEELAEMFDITVRKSVTVGLDYLVIGPNAGPSKIEKAEAVGAAVIDDEGFIELLGKV